MWAHGLDIIIAKYRVWYGAKQPISPIKLSCGWTPTPSRVGSPHPTDVMRMMRTKQFPALTITRYWIGPNYVETEKVKTEGAIISTFITPKNIWFCPTKSRILWHRCVIPWHDLYKPVTSEKYPVLSCLFLHPWNETVRCIQLLSLFTIKGLRIGARDSWKCLWDSVHYVTKFLHIMAVTNKIDKTSRSTGALSFFLKVAVPTWDLPLEEKLFLGSSHRFHFGGEAT